MATVDDVLADLKRRFGADIQAALDWQAQDGGNIVFSVGMDRRAKDVIDAEARAEAAKPESLLARIEALEAAAKG